MENIDIYIGGSFCANTGSDLAYFSGWIAFDCDPQPLSGSSITLYNNKEDYIKLCGVNVYGESNEVSQLYLEDIEDL